MLKIKPLCLTLFSFSVFAMSAAYAELSTLKSMMNKKYVLTIVRNKLVDMIRLEHKHRKKTLSLDKILEDIIINEDMED